MPGAAFLRGDRVTLRTVERDDAEFLQRGHNEPEVRDPLGMYGPQNEDQVEEYIENKVESDRHINLLVTLDEEPIGVVTAMNTHHTRPELAYWLLPEVQGESYGKEAVGLLVDHLFETHEIHGLHAQAFHTNDASCALLESLGFTEEGRLREHRFRYGQYVDTVHYGLLRREWEEDE